MGSRPGLCAESGCALAGIGGGFVPVEVGSRYQQTGLLVVGEAPGENEARESRPFVQFGQAGSLLADSLRVVNIERSELAIVNVLQCRPPRDWLDGAPWAYSAISNCTKNYLHSTIQQLKPKAILALGGTAYRALVSAPKGRYGTLDYVRGYVAVGAGVAEGIPVIPSYHPAFLRRGNPHLTPLLQRDIRRAFNVATGRMVEGKHYSTRPDEIGLTYKTRPTIDEAWKYARAIEPALPLAFDIETPRSTRSDEDERTSFTDRDIKLFQFTQRRGDGIALPFRDEYIDVVRYVISKAEKKVGFNNWNFDDPVLAANGIDVGKTDDAMVLFGYYWSDLPKNLQAAAQGCGFPFPWKHLNETDVEFYGCCDVDATLCVYQYMVGLLKREGMWDSYRRYFAQVWPILRDMARRGIPIDNAKRAELKALIEREDLKVTAEIQKLVPAEVLTTKQKNGLKRRPIVECDLCDYEGRDQHICSVNLGEGTMLAVPYEVLAKRNGFTEIEIGIKEDEKCQCLKKDRDTCDVCGGSGIVPADTVLRRWAEPVEFNPNSAPQVKKFIRFMKHPVPKHAKRMDVETGEASETTEMKELERLAVKTKHPIYPLLIQKRQLTKVEGTYVEGWSPSSDGSVHTTYTYQTATWQTSSRSPNVQNGLKHGKTAFQRELARSFNAMQRAVAGKVLINFDFKSFHALTTAHDFNIPDYARLARIDIHSFVTCYFLKHPMRERLWAMRDDEMASFFKELKRDEEFKFCRDFKAKRAILGIQFGMGYRKLFQLSRDDFENEGEARAVWEMVYHLFPALRPAQDRIRKQAAEEKRLVNKFGAIRHFFDVERWDRKAQKWMPGEQAEQAVAFLPASHAFGHVRDVLLRCEELGYPERYGFCNQIHDSIVAHCDEGLREECIANVKVEMERPSTILIYPKMAPGGFQVDADAAFGPSMSELQ